MMSNFAKELPMLTRHELVISTAPAIAQSASKTVRILWDHAPKSLSHNQVKCILYTVDLNIYIYTIYTWTTKIDLTECFSVKSSTSSAAA